MRALDRLAADPALKIGSTCRIGLISDTHGLLRPQVLEHFVGCDLILHAGDIGPRSILEPLEEIATTRAVRGNNDTADWCVKLPEVLRLTIADQRIILIHDLNELDESELQNADIVISGHSHRPLITQRGALLRVNPGSAGPRRFSLPISIGLLTFDGRQASARLIHPMEPS